MMEHRGSRAGVAHAVPHETSALITSKSSF